MKSENMLWEVLVPKTSNEGIEYTLEHHKAWDEQVIQLTQGMTILSTAKGKWVNLEGHLFVEEMIPVRIYCKKTDLEEVLNYTLTHYNQEAVFAYEISSNVIVKRKE
ncbi:hypothetical protein HY837_01145 [archaeon]|nr:hypothetical protein [archaeon]